MSKEIEVKTPMSGVFYRKPAPDQACFVEVGDIVKKKQTLALLETMKMFQKVKAPAAGKVVKVAAENEQALGDGALMFVLEAEE